MFEWLQAKVVHFSINTPLLKSPYGSVNMTIY
jgi:hypothetical protein